MSNGGWVPACCPPALRMRPALGRRRHRLLRRRRPPGLASPIPQTRAQRRREMAHLCGACTAPLTLGGACKEAGRGREDKRDGVHMDHHALCSPQFRPLQVFRLRCRRAQRRWKGPIGYGMPMHRLDGEHTSRMPLTSLHSADEKAAANTRFERGFEASHISWRQHACTQHMSCCMQLCLRACCMIGPARTTLAL